MTIWYRHENEEVDGPETLVVEGVLVIEFHGDTAFDLDGWDLDETLKGLDGERIRVTIERLRDA